MSYLQPSDVASHFLPIPVFRSRVVVMAHAPKDVTDAERAGLSHRSWAAKLCGGLMAPLLTHLVHAEALSPQERKALRQLMDELDRTRSG